MRAAADQIVVCSGFTQALALLTQVLAERAAGDGTLAVEEYGHRHHRQVIAAHGLAVRPLPVDERGALTANLAGAAGAMLTTAHQFPLGVPLAAERRTRAGGVGRRHRGHGDRGRLRRRVPLRPAGRRRHAGPGAGEHVYAGTASKTLAPGLRLAWLVLPAHLIGDVVAARQLADRQASATEQLTLAELIASGTYDRHVRRCRLIYRRRREHLAAALRQHVPAARMTGVAAGLHVVVGLPPGASEDEVVAAGAARGLALSGLAEYAADGARRAPALVVGFAAPPAHSFTTAIARLCSVLQPKAARGG